MAEIERDALLRTSSKGCKLGVRIEGQMLRGGGTKGLDRGRGRTPVGSWAQIGVSWIARRIYYEAKVIGTWSSYFFLHGR